MKNCVQNRAKLIAYILHMSISIIVYLHLLHFLKHFIYLFLERGEGREKERERNINVCLPLECDPTGDLARNPNLCPEWELNQRLLCSQAGPQITQPHQPGLHLLKFL